MTESAYQKRLIEKLGRMFPGCVILKNDSSYLQGVPDLVIFYEDRYAFLEVKVSATAKEQPNQRNYVRMFNNMSFAAFIYPENEKAILDGLQRSFEARGRTRLSEPQ
jgi:hypothetical protein